ncbi:uncharacterized protein AMSG_03106 [Thecamonas trahens ATCC 50062]|uniref:Ras-GEF domain-containing protein n=1 Tax=Thecamonas trahens ATCC 50062 TaxID=461836 RepID=A0A0L0D3C0_THETB|nr:hypothetical protein AMSG_03106 [Thecamonas trahens ATCC 50062]KNC46670.1 hypothetical protein AMSG_03106 [Thecamonas trahens ATCC 50062]|eukprot:XP_013760440.1 hypothetical protein AMSG_03106 [Thecamonas trahens ATCC 50062]
MQHTPDRFRAPLRTPSAHATRAARERRTRVRALSSQAETRGGFPLSPMPPLRPFGSALDSSSFASRRATVRAASPPRAGEWRKPRTTTTTSSLAMISLSLDEPRASPLMGATSGARARARTRGALSSVAISSPSPLLSDAFLSGALRRQPWPARVTAPDAEPAALPSDDAGDPYEYVYEYSGDGAAEVPEVVVLASTHDGVERTVSSLSMRSDDGSAMTAVENERKRSMPSRTGSLSSVQLADGRSGKPSRLARDALAVSASPRAISDSSSGSTPYADDECGVSGDGVSMSAVSTPRVVRSPSRSLERDRIEALEGKLELPLFRSGSSLGLRRGRSDSLAVLPGSHEEEQLLSAASFAASSEQAFRSSPPTAVRPKTDASRPTSPLGRSASASALPSPKAQMESGLGPGPASAPAPPPLPPPQLMASSESGWTLAVRRALQHRLWIWIMAFLALYAIVIDDVLVVAAVGGDDVGKGIVLGAQIVSVVVGLVFCGELAARASALRGSYVVSLEFAADVAVVVSFVPEVASLIAGEDVVALALVGRTSLPELQAGAAARGAAAILRVVRLVRVLKLRVLFAAVTASTLTAIANALSDPSSGGEASAIVVLTGEGSESGSGSSDASRATHRLVERAGIQISVALVVLIAAVLCLVHGANLSLEGSLSAVGDAHAVAGLEQLTLAVSGASSASGYARAVDAYVARFAGSGSGSGAAAAGFSLAPRLLVVSVDGRLLAGSSQKVSPLRELFVEAVGVGGGRAYFDVSTAERVKAGTHLLLLLVFLGFLTGINRSLALYAERLVTEAIARISLIIYHLTRHWQHKQDALTASADNLAGRSKSKAPLVLRQVIASIEQAADEQASTSVDLRAKSRLATVKENRLSAALAVTNRELARANPKFWYPPAPVFPIGVLDERFLRLTVDSRGMKVVDAGAKFALVAYLTSPRHKDREYERAFLTTFRLFMEPAELVDLLILEFCFLPDQSEVAAVDFDFEDWEVSEQTPKQTRVILVVEKWLRLAFERDFVPDTPQSESASGSLSDSDNTSSRSSVASRASGDTSRSEAMERLTHFLSLLVASSRHAAAARIGTWVEKQLKGLNDGEASPSKGSLGTPRSPAPVGNLSVSVDVDSVSVVELGRQLCLVEHKLYSAIKPFELVVSSGKVKGRAGVGTAALKASFDHFNKVGLFVQAAIVYAPTAKARLARLRKFIELLSFFIEEHNYNGVMEVLGGLSSVAVARLKRLWSKLDSSSAETFNSIKTIMSASKSYKSYRSLVGSLDEATPVVPFLGVYLSDLVFLLQGNDGETDDGLVAFQRSYHLTGAVTAALRWQSNRYSFIKVPTISRVWNVDAQDLDVSEDALYEASLVLEPRQARRR